MILAALYIVFILVLVFRMMVGKPDNKKVTKVSLDKKSKKAVKKED